MIKNLFIILFMIFNEIVSFYFLNIFNKFFSLYRVKDRLYLIKRITKNLESFNIVYVKIS